MATLSCQPPKFKFPPLFRPVDRIQFYNPPAAAPARKPSAQRQKSIMRMSMAISARGVGLEEDMERAPEMDCNHLLLPRISAGPIHDDSDKSPCTENSNPSLSQKGSSQDPIDIDDDNGSVTDLDDELPAPQQFPDGAYSTDEEHGNTPDQEADDSGMRYTNASFENTASLEQSCVENSVDELDAISEVEERTAGTLKSFTLGEALSEGLAADHLSVPGTIPETPLLPSALIDCRTDSMDREPFHSVDRGPQEACQEQNDDTSDSRQEHGYSGGFKAEETKNRKRKHPPKMKRGRPPKKSKIQTAAIEDHMNNDYQPSDSEPEALHSSTPQAPAITVMESNDSFRQRGERPSESEGNIRRRFLPKRSNTLHRSTLDNISNASSAPTAHTLCHERDSDIEMPQGPGIKINTWTCQRDFSSVSISAIVQTSGLANAVLHSIEEAMTETVSMFDIDCFDQIIFSRSTTAPRTWLVSGLRRLRNVEDQQTSESLNSEFIGEEIMRQQRSSSIKKSNHNPGINGRRGRKGAGRRRLRYPEWSTEEEAKLRQWRNEKKGWDWIAKNLDRTESAVKVRWYMKK